MVAGAEGEDDGCGEGCGFYLPSGEGDCEVFLAVGDRSFGCSPQMNSEPVSLEVLTFLSAHS